VWMSVVYLSRCVCLYLHLSMWDRLNDHTCIPWYLTGMPVMMHTALARDVNSFLCVCRCIDASLHRSRHHRVRPVLLLVVSCQLRLWPNISLPLSTLLGGDWGQTISYPPISILASPSPCDVPQVLRRRWRSPLPDGLVPDQWVMPAMLSCTRVILYGSKCWDDRVGRCLALRTVGPLCVKGSCIVSRILSLSPQLNQLRQEYIANGACSGMSKVGLDAC